MATTKQKTEKKEKKAPEWSEIKIPKFSHECENPSCGKWMHHKLKQCPKCGTDQQSAIESARKTGESRKAGEGNKPEKKQVQEIAEDSVLLQLAKKGFKIVRLQNALTGEILEEKIDPKIEKLKLDFKGLPSKADDSTTYVTETGKRILVTMTLERLLSITGTKP